MKRHIQEKIINPKIRIFLFHKDIPQGEVFSFLGGRESDEYKAMLKEGYVDTPAKLDLPKNNDVGITITQAENADPTHLKIMLEKIGFIVMTPEQMKAEINKVISAVIDIKEFTDEALINEAVRRGLKDGEYIEDEVVDESDSIINTSNMTKEELAGIKSGNQESKESVLLSEFKEDPVSLNKDELVYLGNTMFKLGLRMSMLEDTLIAKIKEAINAQ
tara:strand:- start:4435 stop:5088 length:654 start_codon:yes stop_codon:yes gene_type:complete